MGGLEDCGPRSWRPFQSQVVGERCGPAASCGARASGPYEMKFVIKIVKCSNVGARGLLLVARLGSLMIDFHAHLEAIADPSQKSPTCKPRIAPIEARIDAVAATAKRGPRSDTFLRPNGQEQMCGAV